MSPNIEVMLAARFVQGIGGASAVVLSRAIVRDIASGKDAARLMSLMTMIFTVAPVVAPTFGALLVAQWGWRAPFLAIATGGFLILAGIRLYLVETHAPNADGHPLRQLQASFREFFSHRQSIFGLLLIVVPPAGFMSIIAVSSALAVEVYGYSIQAFGLLFALAGLSILVGSIANRLLVTRFELLPLIRTGVALMAIAALQFLVIAWIDAAPFAWVWGSVCLFFFSVPIILSNCDGAGAGSLAAHRRCCIIDYRHAAKRRRRCRRVAWRRTVRRFSPECGTDHCLCRRDGDLHVSAALANLRRPDRASCGGTRAGLTAALRRQGSQVLVQH